MARSTGPSKSASWLLTAMTVLGFFAQTEAVITAIEGRYPHEISMAAIMQRQDSSTGSSTSLTSSGRRYIRGLGKSLEERQLSVSRFWIGESLQSDGSSRFILVDDETSAATFDLTLKQLISVDSGNSITFASTADIAAGLGPWEASPDAGDISVEFVIDSGTGAVIWSHPIFSNMLNFHPAPCFVSSGTTTAVDWIYNPSNEGVCSRFVLQATGGDLPAATATPLLTSIVPTGPQTWIGTTPMPPTSSSSSSTDTDTAGPTETESGITTSTVIDTATITSTTQTTSLVTVTSCDNWGSCDQWTSTTTQTSTTLYTKPCTTALPIPVPVSEATAAGSAWFLAKCMLSASLASAIGFVLTTAW
ncbi:hypothetical protein TWF970_008838 [Orbilia oligospora]|uniref:Uncharacterized protein n=1 Tax=Orbilia oligospora TaxID=2813651 RepID=A0A7C8RMZ1_ORBOL|nr:hypothetical protein TWF970_008838 [Orbilia oligospora]